MIVCVYFFAASIFDNAFFYTKLVGMVSIYFVIAYLKMYEKRLPVYFTPLMCLISGLVLFASIAIVNIIGIRVHYIGSRVSMLFRFNNPIIVIFCISIFYLFKRLKINMKVINYISSLSLVIYLLSENEICSKYIKPVLWIYFEKMLALLYFGSIKIAKNDRVAVLL